MYPHKGTRRTSMKQAEDETLGDLGIMGGGSPCS